ncbi:transporter substrate-binding domain-containing protein [Pseudoduganella sp. FT55W]|uniref:Transporter substrate-binding domain-containing protein n=1 Tax=Duganella rivi TaxID=2666083 RepID=A0A7X4GSN4_9BURK|nr:transporter substrate-binding domain-containing protein [Duganella rivi]MYM67904.1 transporter substrate-binding domain-containing protein [Duganella rivi]
MQHRLQRYAAAAALLLVSASALAGRIEEIKARGYVRIGVSLGGEPVGFRNASNEPVGYDVDVATQLAAKLGVPVRFSDVSSDARISMLMSKQLDLVVANVSITPQRARVVDFSIPYNVAGLRVISQKSAHVKSLADLNGKRVVVGRGTTADIFLKQSAPQAIFVYTDNFAPDGVLLLQQKRVDAGIEDSSLLDYLASKNEQMEILPTMYGNTPIGIAMAKGDPALLKFVNGFVSDYIKSGAYAANYKKWWGSKTTPPVLNP